MSGLLNGRPHEEQRLNISGVEGTVSMMKSPTFEMRIVNGEVTVLRKDGKDIDPDSDEGKALVAQGKAELAEGQQKLDESMKELDRSMDKMRRDMDRTFERMRQDMDRTFRR